MNKHFIKWLSEQKYRFYTEDPLNDDTKQDWFIDGVIEFSISFGTYDWETIYDNWI